VALIEGPFPGVLTAVEESSRNIACDLLTIVLLLETRLNARDRFPHENPTKLRCAICTGARTLAGVIDANLHRLFFTGAHIWRGETDNLENRASSLQHDDCLLWLSTSSSRCTALLELLAAPRHLRNPREFMTTD
jgi:hypothetical protein